MKTKIIILTSIISIILLGSLAAILFQGQNVPVNPVACIYSDGILLHSIELNQVSAPYSITVDNPQTDGSNVILVEPGCISVSEASCPDHLCVNVGKISGSSIPIVCLPNKLLITIENNENEYDGISY